MPNPEEIAVVIADGARYSAWTSVRVERSFDEPIAHATLEVAEPGTVPGSKGIASLRLRPGDTVEITLAGRQVINGYVTARQVAYDKEQHAVQIVVSSIAQNSMVSTVDGMTGQYINNTFQQIANAVLSKVGVSLTIQGSPPGADKPFDRISEHIGDTRFEFIERLARFRNLHLIDDGTGNFVAIRTADTGSPAVLVEGRNIFRARMVMNTDWSTDPIKLVGQQPLNDQNWTQGSSTEATVDLPVPVQGARPLTVPAELPADNTDLQMRANHQRDWTLISQLDAVITVKGWLMDDGSLWWDHVSEWIEVNSPMLFPDNQRRLFLKGVVHRQDNESGTITEILLTFIPGGDGLATQ